jgi:hypothetical protein
MFIAVCSVSLFNPGTFAWVDFPFVFVLLRFVLALTILGLVVELPAVNTGICVFIPLVAAVGGVTF